MPDPGLMTILVNTCDAYEDCWVPFFKLFSTYWPGCPYRILLNTETKDFVYPGLTVHCTKVARHYGQKSMPWGFRLKEALRQVDTELVLYLQEDYFISGKVNATKIEELARRMLRDDIACIRLREFSNAGPWKPSCYPDLWEVGAKARYRISLQAALWRKDRLSRSVRPHEDPWDLEIWGSVRARRAADRILCVNGDLFDDRPGQFLPYKGTGIIRGKWHREAVEDLFKSHGIEMDFSRRGFFSGPGPMTRGPLWRRALTALRSAV